MPRSAVVVVAVLGVVALVASTTFALVRSTQLQASRTQVAVLTNELARARQAQEATPDEQPSEAPSDDSPFGDLFGEGDVPDDLFGLDMRQLARCVQPAGAPGSRDVSDGDVTAQIAEISAIVEDLRELEFTSEPDPQFLNDEQITARLEEEVAETYDEREAKLDGRILSTLGAVPPDVDLIQLQTDLLTTQVAGFYDPETDELVVRADDADEGLSAVAQTTLAHELQHAVADQNVELPIDVTEDTTAADAALAALSVIEGDASLHQQQFTIAGLSVSEQLSLGTDQDVLDAQRELAQIPHFIAQNVQFPYLAGMQFVCTRYLDGGWEAVDALYDELPATTAEIMDPARYGTAPVDPRDPGEPGGGWRRARTTTVGAADLMFLFEAPGDDPGQALEDPRARALDWTGGEVALWTDGDATAVGLALTQREAGGPLCDAVSTWYARAFPDSTEAPTRRGEHLVRDGDQSAVVACAGDEVRLGIGPDLRTARAAVS
jgi:hypothetical protein